MRSSTALLRAIVPGSTAAPPKAAKVLRWPRRGCPCGRPGRSAGRPCGCWLNAPSQRPSAERRAALSRWAGRPKWPQSEAAPARQLQRACLAQVEPRAARRRRIWAYQQPAKMRGRARSHARAPCAMQPRACLERGALLQSEPEMSHLDPVRIDPAGPQQRTMHRLEACHGERAPPRHRDARAITGADGAHAPLLRRVQAQDLRRQVGAMVMAAAPLRQDWRTKPRRSAAGCRWPQRRHWSAGGGRPGPRRRCCGGNLMINPFGAGALKRPVMPMFSMGAPYSVSEHTLMRHVLMRRRARRRPPAWPAFAPLRERSCGQTVDPPPAAVSGGSCRRALCGLTCRCAPARSDPLVAVATVA